MVSANGLSPCGNEAGLCERNNAELTRFAIRNGVVEL